MIHYVISLTKGYHTVIDAIDSDLLQYKWLAKTTLTGGVYASRSTRVNGKRVEILMHRLILSRKLGIELSHEQLTDHRDLNSLNNRRDNLRVATYTDNNRNSRLSKENKSGITGVSWHTKNRKWAAYISVNSKTLYLGTFDDMADAIRARRSAEAKYYGEFAPVPQPNEHEVVEQDSARPRNHKHRYADARMRSDNRSGYKGVWLTGARKKPFAADCAGKHLGTFATAEEASAVYCRAFAEHYGREIDARIAAGDLDDAEAAAIKYLPVPQEEKK